MMTTEVTELIHSLRDGTLSLEEVAQRFRERSWPHSTRPDPNDFLEMAARSMEDPEPYRPGSYDEVGLAYRQGALTREQYRTLSDAVAESLTREMRADAKPPGH